MLNPEIAAKLAECDEIHALGDPGNWMRMYGPIPAIRLFEAYPTLRQHIAAQAARIAELEGKVEDLEGTVEDLNYDADKWHEEWEKDCSRALRQIADFTQFEWDEDGDPADTVKEHIESVLKSASDTIESTHKQADELRAQLTAAQAQNAGLREVVENARCRCSKAVDNHCPDCGGYLQPVLNRGPLNDDQFDAIKAGDWYCTECKDSSIRNGLKHWRDKDLKGVVYQQCDRCAALAATPAASLASVKAGALREFADNAGTYFANSHMYLCEVLRQHADQLEAAAKGEKS